MRPIADENDRLKGPVRALDAQIDPKRDECFRLAARIDVCRARIEAIAACSNEEQLAQLQLAVAQLRHRAGANAHIYGATIDPQHVQNVAENPHNYVRGVHVRTSDELGQRIQRIRDYVAGQSRPGREVA